MSSLEKIDAEIAKVETDRIDIKDGRERDVWNNGYDKGIKKGLQIAKQIIQAEPKITLNKKEIDNVIGIRTDGKYCSFIDGYKITVENQQR